MIILYCGLKQKYLISQIEKFKINEQHVFKFIKKDTHNNIKLYFDTILEDDGEACHIMKNIILRSDFGQILFFNIVSFDGEKITWFH
ncbi:hypothetical protein SAMN02745163_01272 [Clostridium cavendishii DSM 21758]|uniref:Uncharacterized protein n=1 Tax=Clostridium cavendishii DSM 21758 TaxID=1121302 RepID=A0A1M6GF24_9CLOT|nr:hypothetical protein [Clostridium cavendishii]SHJ08552.1 hypothetical protein SAMN02745163_01272 [Clostridium cavendishii DSM 21758]